MIHLIIGRQGSGKTLFLVKVAKEYIAKGQTVYSNVHLVGIDYTPLDYNDIIECRLNNGVVLIDEIHLLLGARSSMRKTNRLICDGFLSMVRKKGLEVYGTTQTLRKVDIRFREEMDYFYECSKFAFVNGVWCKPLHNDSLNPLVPVLIKLEVIEMYKLDRLDFNFFGNDLFNFYDSNQIIKIKGLEDD